MNNIASIILDGNLVADPELREFQSGKSVCSFVVACNHASDIVSYFQVECWNKLADACAKYLKKGNRVTIQGELRQDRWEVDGQVHSRVKILARSVRFDTPIKRQDKPTTEVVGQVEPVPAPAAPVGEDIPL